MKSKGYLILVLLILSSFFFVVETMFARMESTNYVIWADDFNAGGTEDLTSTNYSLQGSIGEAIIQSASSTSDTYGIKAGFREMYPDQYITLSLSAAAVDLGDLSTSAVKSASHTMTINTNSGLGFLVTVSGLTLTSGVNNIDGIGAVAAVSTPGSEQFGLNLKANTSPAVGAEPTGTAPIGSPAGQYATADQFAFFSGNTIASASSFINQTVFTISYIANIAAGTVSGAYSTTLTYAATANF
jgi:hypothetical protein